MPTQITPLPELLHQFRTARKKIAQLQAQGLCLMNAWLERKQALNTKQPRWYWRLRSRHGTLPNGAKTMYIARSDLQEYRKAIARGRKISELERDIRDTQRRIDALIRRAEKRGIVVYNPLGDPAASPEYYTPPFYIELVRHVLGDIDLDPASNAIAQSWIRAHHYYTKDSDGLKQPWSNRIYINPPYGTPETRLMSRKFLEKAITEYYNGNATTIILLLNRTEAQWYKELQKQVIAVCEVAKRINFIDENGAPQQSPRYYSDFLYLGRESETFRRVFCVIGDVKMSS